MSNPSLKDLFTALQSNLISEAHFSNAVSHPVDKGDNSEDAWLSLFTKYLPRRYKAAKATIIDSKGNISDQIDIVLYDGQYSYLALNQNDILYIPAESVYAVFEVKQDLSKKHMEYAGEKARSVRSLHRTSAEIPTASGIIPPKKLHRIVAGILTTNSGWATAYGTPFKRCLHNYDELQQIDCGCVLQEGSFYYDYENRVLRTSTSEDSLVSFFLQLLILLQQMGTVPAIELSEYMKALSITEVKDG